MVYAHRFLSLDICNGPCKFHCAMDYSGGQGEFFGCISKKYFALLIQGNQFVDMFGRDLRVGRDSKSGKSFLLEFPSIDHFVSDTHRVFFSDVVENFVDIFSGYL